MTRLIIATRQEVEHSVTADGTQAAHPAAAGRNQAG